MAYVGDVGGLRACGVGLRWYEAGRDLAGES